MNKYQEALCFFTKLTHRVPLKCATDEFCKKYDRSLSIVKELIDKATPMTTKVIELDKSVAIGKQLFCKGTTFLRKCPSCGGWLHPNYHTDYCGHCGQKIDWSEDE